MAISPARSRKRPLCVVEDDDGQTFVAVPDERRLGCGMLIRGKFHRALVANDRRAAIPLKHFADLYAIEEDCKTRGLDADARGEERRRRSLPLLEAFDEWVDAIHPKLLPKSPLRQATTYAIHQRPFFRRCFEDGRFEIDSAGAEEFQTLRFPSKLCYVDGSGGSSGRPSARAGAILAQRNSKRRRRRGIPNAPIPEQALLR